MLVTRTSNMPFPKLFSIVAFLIVFFLNINVPSSWAVRNPNEPLEDKVRTQSKSAVEVFPIPVRIINKEKQARQIPLPLIRDQRHMKLLQTNLKTIPKTQDQISTEVINTLKNSSDWLGDVNSNQLRLDYVKNIPSVDGLAQDVYVHFVQQQDDADIENSFVTVTLKVFSDRAKIVSAQAQLYPTLKLKKAVLRPGTEQTSVSTLNLEGKKINVEKQNRKIRFIDGQWRRVKETQYRESPYQAVVDEDTGESWGEDKRVYANILGSVEGRGIEFDPIATGSNLKTFKLQHLKLTVLNGAAAYSDALGQFSFPSETATTNISASLSGRWAAVTSQRNDNLSVLTTAFPGTPLNIMFNQNGAAEFPTAQVNAYYHTTLVHDWLQAQLAPNTVPAIDIAIPVNVNINANCNAYYDYASLNFFSAGAGCINSAFDTIIYHEYGHFIDDKIGGITDGGLSEGWGDVLAAYITGQELIGEGLGGAGSFIRRADNLYQYPRDGEDEVHALGQAWVGFAWDLRKNLIAAYPQTPQGKAEAIAKAENLVIPVFLANSQDIPTAVFDVFIRDDNDGDLTNGTPHQAQIAAAAASHAIPFWEDDTIQPAAITDLRVLSQNVMTITLGWTATGDDDQTGQAYDYDLRYSFSPINSEEDFAAATSILGLPIPLPSGQAETLDIFSPEINKTYYFAIRALDNMRNASAISNVATARVEAAAVFSENFETGATGWIDDGLWHLTNRRSYGPGKSFAYNHYNNGTNYDTGARNFGSLTTPPIQIPNNTQDVLVNFKQWVNTEVSIFRDLRSLGVSVDNGVTWTNYQLNTSIEQNVWGNESVGVGNLAGQTVLIRFFFDTINANNNQYEGWYVDNVNIYAFVDNQQIPDPDLVLSGVTLTKPIVSRNDFLDFTYSFSNDGAGRAPSSVIRFNLSRDTNYGGGDDINLVTDVVNPLPSHSIASATTILPFRVPASVPFGEYYLCAKMDENNLITEENENNNTKCSAATLLVEQSDLAMTNITGPSAITAGVSFSVTDTIENKGQARIPLVEIGFYLSTDPIITTSDILISTRSIAYMPSGTNTQTTDVNLPVDFLPGTYYLGAVADYMNLIDEKNENNNVIVAANPVVVSLGVDFIMTALSGPTSMSTNATVSYTVKNQGRAAGQGQHIGFYLSTDATITTSDTLAGTAYVSYLAAGQSISGQANVSIGNTFPPRNYYFGAIADYNNTRVESDETNNALAGNIVNVSILPDLILTNASTEFSQITIGNQMKFTNTVKNIGKLKSAASQLAFHISKDNVFGGTDDIVIPQTWGFLEILPNNTVTGFPLITVPTSTVPGDYYFCSQADPANTIQEENENNNTICTAAKVAVLSRPPFLIPLSNVTATTGQLLKMRVIAIDSENDSLTFTSSALPPGAMFLPLGDVSLNGVVNTLDVQRVQQYVVGLATNLTPAQKQLADFNENGSINSLDVQNIQQVVVGLRTNNKYLLLWTPTAGQQGTYPVTFTVTDGHSAPVSQTIDITVN